MGLDGRSAAAASCISGQHLQVPLISELREAQVNCMQAINLVLELENILLDDIFALLSMVDEYLKAIDES
jgi:hypothetical protein